MNPPDSKGPIAGASDVQIVQRTVGYDGYTRLEKLQLRHRLHRGGWSRTLSRELIERGHAVGVLPYDPVHDAVVLIRQFRVGAYGAGRDPWLVETVAGIVDPGETDEDVARREANEEAGCALSDLIHLCTYFSSPGVLTETVTLYIGIADSATAGGIHGLDHEGEDIEAFVVPWAEAEAQLAAGAFHDCKVVIALQWLVHNRDALRRKYVSERRSE